MIATEVLLACLDHAPPSRDSEAVRLLVNGLLVPAATRAEPSRVWADYRARLAADRPLRHAVAWWVRYLAEQGETPLPDDRRPAETALAATLQFLKTDGPGVCTPASLPAGCARGVVVMPSGEARMTRVHVRFGQWSGFGDGNVIGQPVPGADAAVTAARQHLAAAGCESIDHLQAEVWLEGLFQPVQGESLSLAVFIAAVSVRLRMPLPNDWAFTGALGRASVDSPAGPIMPVNEIQAKRDACSRSGCRHLAIPAHVLPKEALSSPNEACAIEPMATTGQLTERLLPGHALPENPRPSGNRALVRRLAQTLRPIHSGPEQASSTGQHAAYRWVVPGLFGVMLTERWLLGDYLIPEYYEGVGHPPVMLAAALGAAAFAVLAAGFYAVLRLPDRSLDEGELVDWRRAAGALLVIHLLSWLAVQPLIRNPFAPPPHALFFEHRSLQWWKDAGALYLFALVFFLSPYTRIRLAERAAAAGRLRWAREILEDKRWATASLPISSVPVLIVIAAVALAAFGFLDWRALTDPSRAGAGQRNGPWRTVHIIARAQLYVLSCTAALWWISAATSWVTRAHSRDGFEPDQTPTAR